MPRIHSTAFNIETKGKSKGPFDRFCSVTLRSLLGDSCLEWFILGAMQRPQTIFHFSQTDWCQGNCLQNVRQDNSLDGCHIPAGRSYLTKQWRENRTLLWNNWRYPLEIAALLLSSVWIWCERINENERNSYEGTKPLLIGALQAEMFSMLFIEPQWMRSVCDLMGWCRGHVKIKSWVEKSSRQLCFLSMETKSATQTLHWGEAYRHKCTCPLPVKPDICTVTPLSPVLVEQVFRLFAINYILPQCCQATE